MLNIKPWIQAVRLRTLPLAMSSIILGGFFSASDHKFNAWVTILAVITTIFLQILSNLANDYGDHKTGIDNQKRIGPVRSVQSGEITPNNMKAAIYFFTFLSLASGFTLIYLGTKGIPLIYSLIFLLFGILAIAAAINYTIGKNPYGYKGLGDLFVLIFFGLVGVIGTYILNTHLFKWEIIYPAFSVGLMCTAVLNINNIRDIENDKVSGKMTLVVKIGIRNAKTYHAILIGGAFVLAMFYTIFYFYSWFQFLFLLTLPFFIQDLFKILKNDNPRKLDHFLKKQAFHTLLFSITFGLGLIF